MTPGQMTALMMELERLDRDRPVPRLSGSYGAFFYRYADQRSDLVALATHLGLEPVRRDGALSGAALERIVLWPLAVGGTGKVVDTDFGQMVLGTYSCAELLESVALRLWLSAASARELYREILVNPAAPIEVRGDFRWLPPSVITAGTSECRVVDAPTVHEWWHAVPFLKASGDDVNVLPHALDYVQVIRGGQAVLGHVRTLVGRRRNSSELLVPSIMRQRPAVVRIRNSVQLPTADWVHCLAYKEPGEQDWYLIEGSPVDGTEALAHLRAWCAYREKLKPEPGLSAMLDANCREAIERLGLAAQDADPIPIDLPSENDSPLSALIVGTARMLRYDDRPPNLP